MLQILLIEDELIIAKDLQVSLQKKAFSKIDVARDYERAMTLFLKNPYDLVISDINLKSDIDGISLLKSLAKLKSFLWCISQLTRMPRLWNVQRRPCHLLIS